MPTLLLLDSSLSCGQVCEPSATQSETQLEALESRRELIQRGVLHFLELLTNQNHKASDGNSSSERTALMTFSSSAKTIVPFTTDYSKLKSALYDLPMEDRTDITVGLDAAQKLCSEEKSECQIIIATDADHKINPHNYALADHIRLHVIVVTGDDDKMDLDLEDDMDIESAYHSVPISGGGNKSLKTLSSHNHGTYHRIQTNQSQHVTRLKSTFDDVVNQYYSPVKIFLHFGHLQCTYTLYPSRDRITLSRCMGDGVYSGSVLSIIGFLPKKKSDFLRFPTVSF